MPESESPPQANRPTVGVKLDAALCFGVAALLLALAIWQLARRGSFMAWLTFAPDSYKRAAALEILAALWLLSTGSHTVRRHVRIGMLMRVVLCVALVAICSLNVVRAVQFATRRAPASPAPTQPRPLPVVVRPPSPAPSIGGTKPSPLVAAQWPQYRSDNQKTGATIGSTIPAVTWTTETGSPLGSTPIIAGNMVVVGAPGTGALTALDGATGRVVWQTQLPNGVAQEPVVAFGVVVAGYGDNHITSDSHGVIAAGMWPSGVSAHDLRTGARLWSASADGAVMASPVVFGRTVIYATGLRSLVARDIQSGKVVWQRQTPGRAAMASPAIVDSVIVVAQEPHEVCAYEARAGHELWCYTFSPEYRYVGQSAPSVANGTVYLSAIPDSSGWSMLLHRTLRGKLAWVRDYVLNHPSPHYGKQVLAALDVRTGALRWITPLGGGFPPLGNTSGTAVSSGGGVFVVSPVGQAVFALDEKTGAIRWKHPMDRPVRGPPTLIGTSVVVANADGALQMLDRLSGTVLCTRKLPDGVDRAGPSVAGLSVFLAGLHGRVMGLPIDSVMAACTVAKPPR